MKIFISLHCSDDFRFFDNKRLRQKILKECTQYIKEPKLVLDLQIHVRYLEILSTEYMGLFFCILMVMKQIKFWRGKNG